MTEKGNLGCPWRGHSPQATTAWTNTNTSWTGIAFAYGEEMMQKHCQSCGSFFFEGNDAGHVAIYTLR